MNAFYTIHTRNREQYRGELRDGVFQVDGNQFQAANCRTIQIQWSGNTIDNLGGQVVLTDGTCLRIFLRNTGGLFSEQLQANISGEIVLHVESLAKLIRFPAEHIEFLIRESDDA